MFGLFKFNPDAKCIQGFVFLLKTSGKLKNVDDIKTKAAQYRKVHSTIARCEKTPLRLLAETDSIGHANSVDCNLYYIRDTSKGVNIRVPFVVCEIGDHKYAIFSHYFPKDKTDDENSHFEKACERLESSCEDLQKQLNNKIGNNEKLLPISERLQQG